jgi:hypothetical protein
MTFLGDHREILNEETNQRYALFLESLGLEEAVDAGNALIQNWEKHKRGGKATPPTNINAQAKEIEDTKEFFKRGIKTPSKPLVKSRQLEEAEGEPIFNAAREEMLEDENWADQTKEELRQKRYERSQKQLRDEIAKRELGVKARGLNIADRMAAGEAEAIKRSQDAPASQHPRSAEDDLSELDENEQGDKTCAACGKDIPAQSKFCKFCSTPQTAPAAAPPPAVACR